MIELTRMDIYKSNDSHSYSHVSWNLSSSYSSNVRAGLEPVSLDSVHAAVTGMVLSNATPGLESVSPDPIHATVTGVILSALIFMTICGNLLVLLAVFLNAHLRSTTNYFIVNLAVADLLLGTGVLPFSAVLEVIPFWPFGSLFCDIWAAMDVLCCTASILSLCVISIDRYIGVTRPLQHSAIVTEKRALYISVIVWALSVIISVAPLLGWKEPPNPDPTGCQVTKQLGYVLFSVSGSFYIPLIIILVVYFRVYREAVSQSRFLSTGIKTSKTSESDCEVTLRVHKGRPPSDENYSQGWQLSNVTYSHGGPAYPSKGGRQSNNTNSHGDPAYQSKGGRSSKNTDSHGGLAYRSSISKDHRKGSRKKTQSRMTLAGKVAKFKREKKAAKTLGIVVGVFIMCWFPFFFILPLEALCTSCYIPELLFKIIFWLGYCNSMMNPIIYACSSKEFKRAFLRILRCHFRRRRHSFLEEQLSSGSAKEVKKLLRVKTENGIKRKRKDNVFSRSHSSSICNKSRFIGEAINGEQSPLAALKLLQTRNGHIADNPANSDDDSDDRQFEYSDEEFHEPSTGGGREVIIKEASSFRRAHALDYNNGDTYHCIFMKDNHKSNRKRNHTQHKVSVVIENTHTISNKVADTSLAESPSAKPGCLTVRNGFADIDIPNKPPAPGTPERTCSTKKTLCDYNSLGTLSG